MKKIVYLSSVFLLLILLSEIATANFETQVSELISIAYGNNPEILARERIVDARRSDARVEGSIPDPQLTGGYFFTPVETKNGPQEWKVGLNQKLPWFGKLHSKKQIGYLKVDIALAELEQLKLSISKELRIVYTDLTMLKVKQQILNSIISSFKLTESVMRSQYTNAEISQSHMVQIQMEILKLSEQVKSLDDQFNLKIHELQNLLGVQNTLNFNFDDGFENLNQLYQPEEYNINQNPLLRIAQIRTDIAAQNLHLANLNYFPDINIGVDYISLGGDTGKNPVLGKLGISLPLWLGKNKSIKESASASKSASDYSLTDVTEILSLTSEKIRLKFRTADRKYQLYKNELLPMAVLAHETSYTSYIAGVISFTDYLEVERNLLDYQLAVANIQADYKKVLAEYYELTAKTEPVPGN